MQRQDFPSPMWQGSSISCLLRSNSLHRWSPNRNQQLDLLLFQWPQPPRILLFYRCPYRNIWIPPLRNRNSSFRCPSFPTLGKSDHLIISRYVCSNIVANIVTNIYMYVMRHVRTYVRTYTCRYDDVHTYTRTYTC